MFKFKYGDRVRYVGDDEEFKKQWQDQGATEGNIKSAAPYTTSTITWWTVEFASGWGDGYPEDHLELVKPNYLTKPEFELEEIELAEKLVNG